jgi:hypothetical protein
MSGEPPRRCRLLGRAVLFSLASSLGCQGIADIPEVSFSPICKQYCDEVFNVCPASASQYQDRRTCLEVCTVIDKNAAGSTASVGNTIQCRLDTLQDAAGTKGSTKDLLDYCTQAGPGGGKTCTLTPDASDCEGYCALFDLACNGDTENPFMGAIGNDLTGTQSDCIAKCRAIPAMPSPGYTWQTGKTSGDTLGCRLYFVSRAIADPDANCTSAGIRPSGMCQEEGTAPSCGNFCLALTTACTGKLAVYEDPEQCEGVCNVIAPGSKISIDAVDTVGCRNAHAFNALLVSATDHCPHTGPLGANVCGETGNCDAYCFLSKAACPDEFATNYTDADDCTDKCSKLKGAELGEYSVADAKKGGDTVQCRGLAVSRVLALPEAMRGAAACAPVFGDAPCSGG